MENSLASRTFDRASTAMRREAVACLPEIVKLMRTLSRNSSEVSVPELGDIIQKDAVILAKVIAAANTLGYNPAAVPVTTVTQAIHIIGYERIRSLAMSLLLVEQTTRNRGADEQREVAALALTAGCIAQAAAGNRAMINPEEAFVCASLRNFGRIIMVTCMLDDYREAQQLALSHPSDDSFRQIFGLTPLELGHQLLSTADLPEDILATLRAVPPEALQSLKDTPSSQMLALIDFSAQLAELALAPRLNAVAFARETASLASRFEHLLPDLKDEVLPLVESATEQLNEFVHRLNIKSLPLRTIVRLRQRGAGIDPSGSLHSATAPAITPLPARTPEPPVAPALTGFSWQTEIDRIVSAPAGPARTRAQLLSAIAEGVQRGFDAPECLLFAAIGGGDEFALVHARGRAAATLGRGPRLRPGDRTIFGVCLSRGENILIHHAADPKIAPYLPPWQPSPDVLAAFVLLPMLVDRRVHGIVLAGWSTPRQIALSADQAKLLHQLLGLVKLPSQRHAA